MEAIKPVAAADTNASPTGKEAKKAPAPKKAPVEAAEPAEPAAASKKSPAGKKAKKVVEESDEEPEEDEAVTGAMDGFVSSATTTKKTKKKLVEKTFMDDKGYLVTENVWEEVTDDEADSKPHAAKRPTEGAKKGVSSGAANAKKPKPAAAGPQRNMMSFFGKK